MAQGYSAYSTINPAISYADSANLDAFSRLRVSLPVALFSSQMTYDLQPLSFQQLVNGSSASIFYDSTNRMAGFSFSATGAGGYAYMQTYQYFPYSPGRSQLVFLTFNYQATVTNVTKFAGYSDGVNGIEFQASSSNLQFVTYSGTSLGNITVTQQDWNLDPLNGSGPSGYNLNIAKTQILIIDLQALYVGRVRVGFDLDGSIIYAHQFTHSNLYTYPYIQSANLPIRCGMTCSASATASMNFICSAIVSEGGPDLGTQNTYIFATPSVSTTVGNSVTTHVMSIQPATVFNGITNRTFLSVNSINVLVTGNNPIFWQLCVGQALTGSSFTAINRTYSSYQYATAGTLSGAPAIIFQSGYVAASAQTKSTTSQAVNQIYPIALNQSGSVYNNGRLTLLATGIGGSSTITASIVYNERK